MEYTHTDIEIELQTLSERIIDIFKTEPYSALLYSKVLNDIINTFIELRLTKLLSRLEMKPEINLVQYDKHNSIDMFYKKRTLPAKDDQSLNWILSDLIPSYYDLFFYEDYRSGKFDFNDLLKSINAYHTVNISKDDLYDYQCTKNYVKLTGKVSNIYKELLSVLLTINRSFNSSNNSGILNTDLPDNDFKMILVNNGNKIIDVNKVFYHRETNFLIQLHEFLEENGGLIKSLYQFSNREKEIQNIRQYLKTNDLFMFDLIKTDFMLLKDGIRIDNDEDTKLEFIKKIRLNEPDTISHTYLQEHMYRISKSKVDYSSPDIRSKLQEAFNKWLHNPSISEWEEYWFNKKMGCVKNELRITKEINHKKDLRIYDLEKDNNKRKEPFPEYRSNENIKSWDDVVIIFIQSTNQFNYKTINVSKPFKLSLLRNALLSLIISSEEQLQDSGYKHNKTTFSRLNKELKELFNKECNPIEWNSNQKVYKIHFKYQIIENSEQYKEKYLSEKMETMLQCNDEEIE